MINSDNYFLYKNTIRLLLILKLSLLNRNTYFIPFIKKLQFFFSLFKSIDKDSISVYIIFIYLSFFLVKMLFYLNINHFIFRYLIL
jgi:hypothetical protein